jgi:hypothetical protein
MKCSHGARQAGPYVASLRVRRAFAARSLRARALKLLQPSPVAAAVARPRCKLPFYVCLTFVVHMQGDLRRAIHEKVAALDMLASAEKIMMEREAADGELPNCMLWAMLPYVRSRVMLMLILLPCV